MNFLDKIFGQNDNASRKAKKGNTKPLSLSLEPLEERQMLSATALASGFGTISADKVSTLSFDVTLPKDQTTVFTIQAYAADNKGVASLLDPDKIEIWKTSEYEAYLKDNTKTNSLLGAIRSVEKDILVDREFSGSTISIALSGTETTTGTPDDIKYTVVLKGENSSAGAFTCDVFIPGLRGTVDSTTGEISADNVISGANYIVSALMLRQIGGATPTLINSYNTILANYGTSFNNTSFDAYFDLDGSGVVSPMESALVQQNSSLFNASTLPKVKLSLQSDSPFSSDFELSASNSSQSVSVNGVGALTLADEDGLANVYVKFNTGVYVDIVALGWVTAGSKTATITLDEAKLTQINGGTALAPGSYTMSIYAIDSKGNAYGTASAPISQDIFHVVGARTFTISSDEIDVSEKSGDTVTLQSFTPAAQTATGSSTQTAIDTYIYSFLATGNNSGFTVTTAPKTLSNNFTYTQYTLTATDGTKIILDYTLNGSGVPVASYTVKPGSNYNPPLTVGHAYLAGEDEIVFDITVTDLTGQNPVTKKITATVEPVNDAVAAVADSGSINLASSKTVTIDVLANDTDSDTKDKLAIADAIRYTFVYNGTTYTDVSGTFVNNVMDVMAGTTKIGTLTRTADVETDTAGRTRTGKLVLTLEDGAYGYLKAGETGTIAFTYSVFDLDGRADTTTKTSANGLLTVSILGVSDAPVASDFNLKDTTQAAPFELEGTSQTVTGSFLLTAVVADVDGPGTYQKFGVSFNLEGATAIELEKGGEAKTLTGSFYTATFKLLDDGITVEYSFVFPSTALPQSVMNLDFLYTVTETGTGGLTSNAAEINFWVKGTRVTTAISATENGSAVTSSAVSGWESSMSIEDWNVAANAVVSVWGTQTVASKSFTLVELGLTETDILACIDFNETTGTATFNPVLGGENVFAFLGPNQTAVFTFTYETDDTDLASFDVIVTVTGINQAPVGEDLAVSGNVSAESTGLLITIADLQVADVDIFDTHSITMIGTTNVSGVTAVQSGSEWHKDITLANGATARFVGTSANDFNYTQFRFIPAVGTSGANYVLPLGELLAFSINVTVADITGSTDEIAVSGNVVGTNKAPAASATPVAKSGTEGATSPIVVNASDWFTDPNTGETATLVFDSVSVYGNTLLQGTSYTIPSGAHAGTVVTFTSTGTIEIDVSNAAAIISSATSSLSFVTTAKDIHNAVSAASTNAFVVTGINDYPVAPTVDPILMATNVNGPDAFSTTLLTVLGFTDPDTYNSAGTTVDAETGLLEYYINEGTTAVPVWVELTTALRTLANGDKVKLSADGLYIEYYTTSAAALALGVGATLTQTFEIKAEDPHSAQSAVAEAAITLTGVDRTPVASRTLSANVATESSVVINAADYFTRHSSLTGGTFTFTSVYVGGQTLVPGGAAYTFPTDTEGNTYTVTLQLDGKIKIDGTLGDGIEDFAFSFGYVVNDGLGGEKTVLEGAADEFDVSITRGLALKTGTISGSYSGMAGQSSFNLFTDIFNVPTPANIKYSISSVVIPSNEAVEDPGVSFLSAAALAKLVAGTDLTSDIVFDFAAYSSRINTTEITFVITIEDTVSGIKLENQTITIKPSVQKTVDYYITVTQTRIGESDRNKDENDLPSGDLTGVNLNSSYYIQVWAKDTSFSDGVYGNLVGTYGLASFIFDISVHAGGAGALSFVNLNEDGDGMFSASTYPEPTVTRAQNTGDGENLTFFPDWSIRPTTNDDGTNPAGVASYFMTTQFTVQAISNGTLTFSLDYDIENALDYIRFLNSAAEEDGVHSSQIALVNKTVSVTQGSGVPLTGLSSSEDKIVEGGVYVRTVAEPTNLMSVDTLPKNADWIHEWQTHYAEIWVKASETKDFASAITDLRYDTTKYTAVNVELNPIFGGGSYSINDAKGIVSGIGGEGVIESQDGYVLLGRVKFQSVGTDNVAWSDATLPQTLGMRLSGFKVVDADGKAISRTGARPNTEVWANPYDSNDDGVISVKDFSSFIKMYGKKSTADNPLVSGFDFNKSGSINTADFSQFIKSYGTKRADVASGKKTLTFAANFTQRYVGATLQTDDSTLVGTMLDAANKAWANALGVSKIDVTLVVKDYGKSSQTLGEAVITALDENGKPIKATIYLDDDAAGNYWYSQMAEPVADGKYDLYTTLLHELGHAYGINGGYGAYSAVYSTMDFDSAGHSNNESSVMYYGLETGVRKYLALDDVLIVLAAYNAADANTMFAKSASALTAISVSAGASPAANIVISPTAFTPAADPIFADAQTIADLQRIGLAVSVPTQAALNRDGDFDAALAEFDAEYNTFSGDEEMTELDIALGEIFA